jgi:hypothetical protein
MQQECFMRPNQLARFARFLDEHPDFAPLLIDENALVCGFQVGRSFLGIDDMETILATEPHFDRRQAALLLAPLGARGG